ncbi:hypothetical protein [Microcoleus sp.]|uniref:hypothetical protein n=1 Tax=Microcoleus sp. TaxID=44472 RepID=UPI003524A92A
MLSLFYYFLAIAFPMPNPKVRSLLSIHLSQKRSPLLSQSAIAFIELLFPSHY